ncbi:MAG TPA: CPXCG motif-containing cysteine-rich protein [Gemmatimonadales bacterium]|nr:CPXCG motif-containing cysteine-rich protein [Gemmatimonadales bacterium]
MAIHHGAPGGNGGPPDGSDDFDLDREFELGDGTADREAVVYCPHCGEPNEIALDPGSGPLQEYVEDCQVCCQPWLVTVRYHADGSAEVRLRTEE